MGTSSPSAWSAEPDGFPMGVEDREQQAVAELVLEPVRPVHEREAGVEDVVAREVALLEVLAEPVPVVGGPAELEAPGGVAVEASAVQVLAGRATVSGFDEEAMVEVDGGGGDLDEAGPARPVLGGAPVVVAQRDPGPLREPLDRFDEVEVLDFADEGDGVTRLLAAEAVVEPERRVDRERRGLLLVEGAEPHPALTDALQRHVLAGHRDEVGRLSDPRDVLVEDPHRGSGYGASGVAGAGQTPRGRSSGGQPSSSTPRASA